MKAIEDEGRSCREGQWVQLVRDPHDAEVLDFAGQLMTAFLSAGWRIRPSLNSDKPNMLDIVLISATGDEDSVRAADLIVRQLQNAGVQAGKQIDDGGVQGPLVTIYVAPKPLRILPNYR